MMRGSLRLLRVGRAHALRNYSASSLEFANGLNPDTLSASKPHRLSNLVGGRWIGAAANFEVVDPMKGEPFLLMPRTSVAELGPFVESLSKVPKSGMHNAYKNPERYVQYGAISGRAAGMLAETEIAHHFARCIQRVMPKSYEEAMKCEVTVTRDFLYNFSGDGVRFLARGFTNPGNHMGQMSTGNRWPYGPVVIISPFNFPLEIPALQLMGALYMGNKPLIKNAEKTSMVIEQFVRLLIAAGMPPQDVDLLHCSGSVVSELLRKAPVRMTQFTGGAQVSEQLCREFAGKVKVEDAGFDWKIIGPDVGDVDYVAWQCDQDAYACSGQKCSAQSLLFVHENWLQKTDLVEKLKRLAARRQLSDLTIGPVISHTTKDILQHTARLAGIPGAKVLFGGKELSGHHIPPQYGAVEPTAVFVPLEQLLKREHFEPCTTELFGPFQVVTSYSDAQLPQVLEACERIPHHLTAAVVSNDIHFVQRVLGSTVNGTTYAGRRARTTGAPQNHWFGPAGDPRGAGIGSAEAIQMVWSCHREIINDFGPVSSSWATPPSM